jgi:hypothetical protein
MDIEWLTRITKRLNGNHATIHLNARLQSSSPSNFMLAILKNRLPAAAKQRLHAWRVGFYVWSRTSLMNSFVWDALQSARAKREIESWERAGKVGSPPHIVKQRIVSDYVLAFNFHSATHEYYHLIWLPFAMVGAVELALKALPSDGRPLCRPAVIVGVICLAILSIGERDIGFVERMAGNPAVVRPLIHLGAPPIDARDIQARSALLGLRDRTSFVAYLGNSGWNAFTELGMRGWVVTAPPAAGRFAERQIQKIPASVLRQLPWRQLSSNWFRERLSRGTDAVLIERGGTWDTPEVLGWARAAGLCDGTAQPPGFILLLAGW